MVNISLDNGLHFYDVDDIISDTELQDEIIRYWNTIVKLMDDSTRVMIAWEGECNTKIEFLQCYLDRAPFDLIIGLKE